jgi:hypothetical protein
MQKFPVLWHKRLRKYVKCYKQERFYNAELPCEEVEDLTFLSKHFNSSLIICEALQGVTERALQLWKLI